MVEQWRNCKIELVVCPFSGPLSLGSIASGRLKNLKDVDKWSSLSLCLSVRVMSITGQLGLYLCSWKGRHIALSINTQYKGSLIPNKVNYKYWSEEIRS